MTSSSASSKTDSDSSIVMTSSTSTRGNDVIKRRVREMDKGWSWAVMIASFATHMLMSAVYFGYSVLTPQWKQHFHTTSAATSLVGSAASGFSSGLAPVASYLSNRYDHRTTHMIGGFTAALGLFLCSFATSLEQVFVFYGFLGGLGIGISYLPAVMILKDYFRKRYAVVIGFASAGIGVGSCLFPVLIEYLESIYGWQGTMLILSAVMANLMVSAAVMFPNHVITTSSSPCQNDVIINEVNGNFLSREELSSVVGGKQDMESDGEDDKLKKEEAYLQKHKQHNKKQNQKGERRSFASLSRMTWQNRKFLLHVINNFTNFLPMMLVIGLTPMRCQFEFGMSPEQGALLASAIGFSNMFARFGWGALCNLIPPRRFDAFNLFLVIRLVTSVVILVTSSSTHATSFSTHLVYCVLLGAGFGNWSLYPIYIPRIFDAEIVDTVFGYLEIFNGAGCLVGPFVGGMLYDVTGSFVTSYVVAGSVLMTGAVVCFGGSRLLDHQEKRRRERRDFVF